MIKSLNSAAFVLIIILGWSFKGAAQTDSVQVSAQTNFFPVLKCASNVVYTNATILRVTPAEASVSFDGGIAKVPLQNLPEFLRQRYHYDPTNAAQYALAEKARAKARKLAQVREAAEQERLDAANRGNLCTIQVEQILDNRFGYPKCVVSGGGGADASVPSEVLLMNLPDSVKNFVNLYNQLQNDILTFGDKIHNDAIAAAYADAVAPQSDATVAGTVAVRRQLPSVHINTGWQDFHSPNRNVTTASTVTSPQVTPQRAQANLMAVNVEAEASSLEQMKADLETMTENLADKTQVKAYFTGKSYANFQIWECVQN